MNSFLLAFEPVIIVFHFIVAFMLIGIILLQAGKGTDIGAVFGAGARSVVGSTAQGNILTRVTTVAAIVFLLTSLSLATLAKFHVAAPSSVLDTVTETAQPGSTDAVPVDEGTAETTE